MYLCQAAVTKLIALDSIKDLTASRYFYQVIGRLLGTGESILDHPFALSLTLHYEIFEPLDPRLNVLGIKGMMRLGIRLCIMK